MSCTPPVRTLTVARNQPVWSQGGATNPGLSDIFVFTGDEFMQVAPMLSQVRATLIVDNRTLNAEIEVVMQSTLDGINWSNPIAALATVNRLSGLDKLGSVTAIGGDGGDQGGGATASPHRRGDITPLKHLRCWQLCDDIDYHQSQVNAITQTMGYETPGSAEWQWLKGQLDEELDEELDELAEVAQACADKECPCRGGQSDLVS